MTRWSAATSSAAPRTHVEATRRRASWAGSTTIAKAGSRRTHGVGRDVSATRRKDARRPSTVVGQRAARIVETIDGDTARSCLGDQDGNDPIAMRKVDGVWKRRRRRVDQQDEQGAANVSKPATDGAKHLQRSRLRSRSLDGEAESTAAVATAMPGGGDGAIEAGGRDPRRGRQAARSTHGPTATSPVAQTKHEIQSLLAEAGSPAAAPVRAELHDRPEPRPARRRGGAARPRRPGDRSGAGDGDADARNCSRAGRTSSRSRSTATWRRCCASGSRTERTFTLIEGDALAGKHELNAELVDAIRAAATPRGQAAKLVANLPYNIASPLVIELLIAGVELLAFTVQKEVADRLRAAAGSEAYGPLTVMAQMLGAGRGAAHAAAAGVLAGAEDRLGAGAA